jgi:hypothetical protein
LRTTSTERVRLTRQRKRQGKLAIRLLINEDEVDFLLARGYPLKRTRQPLDRRGGLCLPRRFGPGGRMGDQLIGLLIVIAAKCSAGCGAISR